MKKKTIWESIIEIVKFLISNKIESKVILDQYKELYDKDNKNIKEIIDLINKDSSNKVKLIVSSSINNNDVRSLLLKTWFPDYDKVSLLFPYSYFDNLFDSNLIVEFDQSLSESQRIYINDYFNNIPKFYYEIKNKKDEELEGYKNHQQKKIFDKITSFYEDNLLSFNDFEILLKYRHKIGKILKEDELYQLIKILPIKYFTLRNNVINFYFSLVENAFDEYLSNKIYSLLRGPMHGIADRIIGDMLEFILLTDLKNNKFDKFDETIKIESIWDLNTNERFKINNIEGKDILILQTEPKAIFRFRYFK